MTQNGDQSEAEADSEAEKMSPLLDTSRSTDAILACSPRSEKAPSIPSSPPHPVLLMSQGSAPTAADDSDYYTPDDQGPGILLDSDKVCSYFKYADFCHKKNNNNNNTIV